MLFPPDQEQEESKGKRKKSRTRSTSRKRTLSLKEFQQLMENLNYTILRPMELRQRFTEYVLRNKKFALEEQSQFM